MTWRFLYNLATESRDLARNFKKIKSYVNHNESGIFSWVMFEIIEISSTNLEQSSSFMPVSRAKQPKILTFGVLSDWVAYKKKIFGIVLVIAIFVAICLCSFYPFSQMTDSWALKVILFLTLLIGNVIGVLIILIGIVILICSKFFL